MPRPLTSPFLFQMGHPDLIFRHFQISWNHDEVWVSKSTKGFPGRFANAFGLGFNGIEKKIFNCISFPWSWSMVFHLQIFQAAGRLQWCDQKGQYRSAWGCGWRNLMWGFPSELNLFLPGRVKVNSAVQTHLYSAARGYKWYFLFLTNMNIVFALKIHHFS